MTQIMPKKKISCFKTIIKKKYEEANKRSMTM